MPISKLSKFQKQISKRYKKSLKRWRRESKRYHKRRKKLAKKYYKWLKKNEKNFALVGFFLGVQIAIIGGVYLWSRQSILSFKVAPSVAVSSDFRQPRPTLVKIETAGIELAVVETAISDGIWQTADVEASHLATSARPGEKGNIVIYGHNKRLVFGSLNMVNINDEITVLNEDGQEKKYLVQSKQVVSADEIDVVLPTEEETLTVYTCTGWLDSKRLVLQAYPK